MAPRTATAVTLALAGATLAGTTLTACTSNPPHPSATPGAQAASSTTGAAVSAQATLAGRATQLTGTELMAALPPASYFPPGYPVTSQSSSGSHLRGTEPEIDLATAGCDAFTSSATNGEFGASAYAVRVYSNNLGTQSFAVTVYQAGSQDAATTLFGDIRSAFGHCGPSSLVSARGGPAAPLDGRPAARFDLLLHGKYPSDLLMTVASTDVFLVVKEGVGAPPPASPDLRAVLPRVVARVLAAQQQG